MNIRMGCDTILAWFAVQEYANAEPRTCPSRIGWALDDGGETHVADTVRLLPIQLPVSRTKSGLQDGRLGRDSCPRSRSRERRRRHARPRHLIDGTNVPFMSRIAYTLAVDFQRPVEAVVPGAQGRILAVLVETSAELNLRTIARLSGVSVAHASRVLPGLVELGIVERRDVPPSALFRFVAENVAARAVSALADAWRTVLSDLGERAGRVVPSPVSVVVFGSFARGEADRQSDLDVVFVRPAAVGEEDPKWRAGVDRWVEHAQRLTGNTVELLEVIDEEAARLLRSRKQLWSDIQRDGVVVHGLAIDELRGRRSA